MKITGAYAAGPFVYSYKNEFGDESDVDYIIYPVISSARLSQTADGGKGGHIKASVILKGKADFKVKGVAKFKFDTAQIPITGVVRTHGILGMPDEEKKLLQKGSLDLDDNFIYVETAEAPTSPIAALIVLAIAALVLFLSIRTFMGFVKDQKAAAVQMKKA